MCCLDCWTWRCSVDANATRWTGWERWERWERWELGAGSRRTARTMCACLGRFTRQGGLASLTLAAMVLLARHANCSTARHVGGGWCCYCPVRACCIGLGCRSRSSARLGWDRQSERTVGIPFVGRGRLLHRARASCTERLGRRWRRAESARTLAQTDKNKLNKLPSFCSRTETCSVLGAPVPFQFTTSIAAPLHLASLDRPRSTVPRLASSHRDEPNTNIRTRSSLSLSHTQHTSHITQWHPRCAAPPPSSNTTFATPADLRAVSPRIQAGGSRRRRRRKVVPDHPADPEPLCR